MKSALAMLFAIALAAHAPAETSATFPDVRFEQRIGESLPLETEFIDVAGDTHPLGDYFGGGPAVLYFGYERCPQLCSIVADGTVAALRQIRPAVGRDVTVIAISIDPTETIAEARTRERDAVRRYGEAGDTRGWHFLRGSESAIRAVAAASGFRYAYDPVSRQYAHPSGFVVLTPKGVISRYFLGVDFPAAEVSQAVTRAARGETGRPVVDLLLRCLRGDGITGRYGKLIWRVLAASVVLTVLILAGGVTRMLAAERRTLREKIS